MDQKWNFMQYKNADAFLGSDESAFQMLSTLEKR
jgi:hypothetical protein